MKSRVVCEMAIPADESQPSSGLLYQLRLSGVTRSWHHFVHETDLSTVLSGVVEADETFFARSYKGSHFKNKNDPNARREDFYKAFGRYPRKHSKEVHKRGRSKEQVPVLVLRDRTARTVSLVMPSMKTEEISRQM